jgi:hypothetical protein
MLAHGITFRPASDLLNRVYVEVATAELERAGQRATDSRLTTMTGIHRKALRQLRAQKEQTRRAPGSVALSTQLVLHWKQDARFCEADGSPSALPRRNEADGREPTFDHLVRSISSDVHPRTVLDECLRLGVVRVDEHQWVHLEPSALLPSRDFDEQLIRLGRNLHDHLETAVRNLECSGPSQLEHGIHCDGLRSEDVNRLALFAEQQGMKLLAELERRAREMRERAQQPGAGAAPVAAAGPAEKTERMGFGLYFFRGPAEASEGAGSRRGDGRPGGRDGGGGVD